MAGRVVSSFKGQTDLKDVRKRTVRVVCQVVQLERRLKNGWLVAHDVVEHRQEHGVARREADVADGCPVLPSV